MSNPSPGGVDMHAHTVASDGSLSPAQLIEQAHALGLSGIAVTDHDTIAGLGEARAAARHWEIDFLPGVELSVEDDDGRFHLLGYGFDPDDAPLADALHSLRDSRAARNQLMGERMAALGLPVTMADVIDEAGPDSQVVARPHFAKALMKAGIVTSVAEAFDRFLSVGRPLYLPKDVLTPRDAADLLHRAGGVAVMAHPGLIPSPDDVLAARVRTLAHAGALDGIEACYSQHSPAQTANYRALASDLGLIVTGGSDFHGALKPHVPLGRVADGMPAPRALWDGLFAAVAARRNADAQR